MGRPSVDVGEKMSRGGGAGVLGLADDGRSMLGLVGSWDCAGTERRVVLGNARFSISMSSSFSLSLSLVRLESRSRGFFGASLLGSECLSFKPDRLADIFAGDTTGSVFTLSNFFGQYDAEV